jgi:hypothetical protein
MSPHLPPDEIAGVAMLSRTGPERRAIAVHLRECDTCRLAVEEAERALGVIDALAAPPAARTDVLARARAAVHAQMTAISKLAAALVAGLAVVAFAGVLALAPPIVPVPWALIGIVLAISGGATFLGLSKGSDRSAALALATTIAAAAIVTWISGFEAGPARSHDCALFELGAAMLPLVGALVFARTSRLRPTALTVASAAACGALAGQLAIQLACPDRHLDHVLVFHLGAVIAAAIAGALIGGAPLARPRAA